MRRILASWSGLRSVLLVSVLVLCTGGKLAALDKAIRFGTNEVDGLRSQITAMSWKDGNRLDVHYQLEWTSQRNMWALDIREPVNVSSWNDAPQLLSIQMQTISLHRNFVARSVTTQTATVTVQVPAGATAISLALGTSGLETARTPLPAK
jgi:hypothetical protein